MIPMEVINKILVYVSELNHQIIMTQYLTNKPYYVINFNSDLLWKIKATLMMKRLYPIYSSILNNGISKNNIELYKNGVSHYKKYLMLN